MHTWGEREVRYLYQTLMTNSRLFTLKEAKRNVLRMGVWLYAKVMNECVNSDFLILEATGFNVNWYCQGAVSCVGMKPVRAEQ